MKKIVTFIACILLGVIAVFPIVLSQYPNLLDISETVRYKSNSLLSLTHYAFTEKDRFRPLYYLARFPVSRLCEYSVQCYFVTYGVFVGIAAYMLYIMVRSNFVFVVVGFFLFCNPIIVDAFWRFGAAETTLGFLLLLSCFLYARKLYTPLCICLILGSMSKESFVYYLPVFLVGVWLDKKRYHALLIILLTTTMFLLLLPRWMNAMTTSDSYASSITVGPTQIMTMVHIMYSYMQQYYPLILASVASLIAVYFSVPKVRVVIFLVALLVVGLAPLIMTNNVQAYYLLPTLYINVLLMGYVLKYYLSKSKTRPFIVLVSVYCVAIILFLPNTVERMRHWSSDYAGDNLLILWIRKNESNYSTIRIEGRSEYQGALVFLLHDAQFTGQKTPKNSFVCESEGDYVTGCSRQSFSDLPRSVLLTEEYRDGNVTALCSEASILNSAVCKWRVYTE